MNLGVLRDMVERHADEAAFLWCQRSRGSRSPSFSRATLAEWDERLEANLEGLLIAAAVGLEHCQQGVDRGVAGAVFGTVYLAAELGDAMAFAKLAVAAETDAGVARELIGAISWLSAPVAERVLAEMSDERAPLPLRRLALKAYAACGRDPGALLESVLDSGDALDSGGASKAESALVTSGQVDEQNQTLCDIALQVAGPLGREDLLDTLKQHHRAEETTDAVLWAACSAVALGDDSAAASLWRYIEAHAPGEDVAQRDKLELACRYACHCPAEDNVARLKALAEQPETRKLALVGAAALGDPAAIPFVLPLMQDEALARRAGWVYASITGLTLEPPLGERKQLDNPTTEQIARRIHDPIEDLPLPSHDAVVAHWQSVQGDYQPGTRYFDGKPLTPEHMQLLLDGGRQPSRHECAIALSRLGLVRPLFNPSAPSRQQQRALAST